MIKRITFFCLTVFLAASVSSVVADDHVELTIGKANDGIDVYRVALRKSWVNQWLVSETGKLSGFHTFSFNHWHGGGDSLNAIAYSPVFVYRFNDAFISYLKLGVGVAYLSDTTIRNRNLSSHFQFEDQLGVGWEWDVHDLSLVYMHYSNAGIKDPNQGIDMVVLSYTRRI